MFYSRDQVPTSQKARKGRGGHVSLKRKEVLGINLLFSFIRTAYKTTGQKIILLRVFVAAVTSAKPLPNDTGTFTETLGSNDRGIHIQTQRLMEGGGGGLMKHAVQMGLDATIDI